MVAGAAEAPISIHNGYDGVFAPAGQPGRCLSMARVPFTLDRVFNSIGQLEQVVYPANGSAIGESERLAVQYAYSHGRLLEVSDRQSGQRFWRRLLEDRAGRVVNERIGGRFDFVDKRRVFERVGGRLAAIEFSSPDNQAKSRIDYRYNLGGELIGRRRRFGTEQLSERFEYDGLDRLVGWREDRAGEAGWEVQFEMDGFGDLTSRRVFENGTVTQLVDYRYGETAAPTGAPGSDLPVTAPAGGAVYEHQLRAVPALWDGAFAYDEVGRITEHPKSGSITYGVFDFAPVGVGQVVHRPGWGWRHFRGNVFVRAWWGPNGEDHRRWQHRDLIHWRCLRASQERCGYRPYFLCVWSGRRGCPGSSWGTAREPGHERFS